ncbi:hypothetical protein SLE2022_353520 [Rubroshorea leprosula]
MRRHEQYPDSGANAYLSAQMQQHMPGQIMEQNSTPFQGQLEAFTPERDQPAATSSMEGQWGWERDGSKVSNQMAGPVYNEGQWADRSITYFQGQRPDLKSSEKQNADLRSRQHEEDMEIGYEDNHSSKTFEGLEKKFLDDIMKLAKEQNDAEDAENARHRERINAINAQYQEQLAALRARHANRRDEFLLKESHARQQQYQQTLIVHYPNIGMGSGNAMTPGNPHGYSGVAGSAMVGDANRVYNSDPSDSYRERTRFLGAARDQGFETRGSYPGGRVYDTGSRYY